MTLSQGISSVIPVYKWSSSHIADLPPTMDPGWKEKVGDKLRAPYSADSAF